MGMGSLLGKTLDSLRPGDKLSGTVVGISPSDIYVDLGYKYPGCVLLSELTDDLDIMSGDQIEVCIMRVDHQEGIIYLSLETQKGANEIANNDIQEICDAVREEVLTEVRNNLSQMKPDIISSITEEVVREMDSRYASQIGRLENRISELERRVSNSQNDPVQQKASAGSSPAAERIDAERVSCQYGAFRFNGWVYYPNKEMGDFLYRVRDDGTENTQLTDYSVWTVNRVEDGYLYYDDKHFKERKLKLS